MKKMRGVTLIEIAIVLVIIGLLLGGVLKGQELINNAKVRAIADRQAALKVAWFAFIDRYRALPGDYVQAARNIPGGSVNGEGNGIILEKESPLVFQHLTAAGFLRCAVCTNIEAVPAGATPSGANSLQNQYGGIMAIFHDNSLYAYKAAAPTTTNRLMVHTGGNMPSNILFEVDSKIDEGSANQGDMVFNAYYPGQGLSAHGASTTAGGPDVANCMAIGTGATNVGGAIQSNDVMYWRFALDPPEANCGASILI